MKNKFRLRSVASILAVLLVVFGLTSCNRDDNEEDVLPEEEMTNIILKVTDDAGHTVPYNFVIGSVTAPTIKLENGKTYNVETEFWNGDENVNDEIKDAKENHFIIFNFPNSKIDVQRLDGADSTTPTHKVGLTTKWTVNKVNNSSNAPTFILNLKHADKVEDLLPVSEAAVNSTNGIQWGSVGSKANNDAYVTFGLSN